MLEMGSRKWHEMIFFRDSLRSHPRVAADYAEAKLELAAQYAEDRSTYQLEKDKVIVKILAQLILPDGL